MAVRHCLLALPGVEKADIKRVLSHPQALAQTDSYTRRMPGVVREAVDDTGGRGRRGLGRRLCEEALQKGRAGSIVWCWHQRISCHGLVHTSAPCLPAMLPVRCWPAPALPCPAAGAAKLIMENEWRDAAAVASRRAGELYGLNVLDEDIQVGAGGGLAGRTAHLMRMPQGARVGLQLLHASWGGALGPTLPPSPAPQDMKDNVTRFVVLSRDPLVATDALASTLPYKTSIVFSLQEVGRPPAGAAAGPGAARDAGSQEAHAGVWPPCPLMHSCSAALPGLAPAATLPAQLAPLHPSHLPAPRPAGPRHAVQGAERVCAARHRHDQD